MTGPAAEVLAAGLELADLHRDATNELRRHRPDADGICEGCGDEYPCSEERATIKVITVIESRWRHESDRLAATGWPESAVAPAVGARRRAQADAAADETSGAEGVPGDEGQG